MILAIFVLAIVLLVSGGAGLVSAINLVPTDLGFTYFQSGAMMLAAGAVILALGLATRVIDRGLARLASPPAARAVPLEPLVAVTDQKPPDAIFAGGAAVGAATVGAMAGSGAGLSEGISPEFSARTDGQIAAVPDERLEDFERDLFAELESRPASPPVTSENIAAASGVLSSVSVAVEGAVAAPSDEGIQSGIISAGTDAGDAAPEPALPRADMSAPFWADAGRTSRARDKSDPADHDDPAEPLIATPETTQPDPPLAAVPGLIDDADLAAVSDESLPPLAPISTLDVVGSYDSGGTRFTMYSDGSVTTAGPQGENRYRSLEELRRHLDAGTA